MRQVKIPCSAIRCGLVTAFLCALISACATNPMPEPVSTAPAAAHNNLYATLYLHTAAEHKALSLMAYRAAAGVLDEALSNSSWSAALEQDGDFEALPPGIIFDVDETVLDNSAYQATLISENLVYRSEHWDRWVAAASAPAVEGAIEFSRAAVARGATLLYLTNRRCKQREPGGDACPQRAETIANLVTAGFPEPEPGNVLLRSAEFDFERDKKTRREAFARRFRLLMLFGDDLGDFLPGVKDEGAGENARNALVRSHADRWGRSWFVLPNPSYGSWLDVLGEDPASHLRPWRDTP